MRLRIRLGAGFFALFSLLAFTGSLYAQLPTATLNGIVTDPQGAVVVGARIVLTNKATGITHEETAGAEGQYVLANLEPGAYDIRVEGKGFAAREYKDVQLEVGRIQTLDVSLALLPWASK